MLSTHIVSELYPTSERQCRLPTSKSRPPKAVCPTRAPTADGRPSTAISHFFRVSSIPRVSFLLVCSVKPENHFIIFFAAESDILGSDSDNKNEVLFVQILIFHQGLSINYVTGRGVLLLKMGKIGHDQSRQGTQGFLKNIPHKKGLIFQILWQILPYVSNCKTLCPSIISISAFWLQNNLSFYKKIFPALRAGIFKVPIF